MNDVVKAAVREVEKCIMGSYLVGQLPKIVTDSVNDYLKTKKIKCWASIEIGA